MTKNSNTHTDEIKQMERAIDEGFAESEKDLKDKKTPLDTHTDWEKRIIENNCPRCFLPYEGKMKLQNIK